jgi:hypothetical protein
VASCPQPPLVVPYVHSGMESVAPRGAAAPRMGGELRIKVGEPVPVADLLEAAAREGWDDRTLHAAIADRVGGALYRLKAELDGAELAEVAPWGARAMESLEEDSLLPLIGWFFLFFFIFFIFFNWLGSFFFERYRTNSAVFFFQQLPGLLFPFRLN